VPARASGELTDGCWHANGRRRIKCHVRLSIDEAQNSESRRRWLVAAGDKEHKAELFPSLHHTQHAQQNRID
jgi:hypothetical protein